MTIERHDHHRNCHHKMYRLSCVDFDDLYEVANGACQICKTPEPETKRGKLVIDHAPQYDWIAVRGLLCDKCNSLMRYADAGRYEPLSYPYLRNAWFIRALMSRRKPRPAPTSRPSSVNTSSVT